MLSIFESRTAESFKHKDASLEHAARWRQRYGYHHCRRQVRIAAELQKTENLIDTNTNPGGTAGCTVAGRLAAADPNLSILLIEGGRDNYDVPSVVHLGLVTHNLAPQTLTANFHKANASTELSGREVIVPTGGCLGGGSSVNLGLCVVDSIYSMQKP